MGSPPVLRGPASGPTQEAELWNPSFWSFIVAYAGFFAIAWIGVQDQAPFNPFDWYASVVWTLPAIMSAVGLAGGIQTARRLRERTSIPPAIADTLLVVVPTIGRRDTYPALERVIRSYCQELPRYFASLRVDIVIEHGCEQGKRIAAMAEGNRRLRVISVPRGYQTPNFTQFKARAIHYAHVLRQGAGEARDDVWILHMDDDTGVGGDTARELARFVNTQVEAGEKALHLGQGVLCFPREHARNRLVWLADAVRPGCDIALFAATTGSGSPRAGLHGELLLVRASAEAAIGWDFGPRTIVEDAQFALAFCERYPGRSGWIPGRSYGASPISVSDFVKQRERWIWGLLELAANPSIPVRRRLLLLHNVIVWCCAAISHPVLVVAVAGLLGHGGPTPVSAVLVPLWALNMGFCFWLYWEGLKVNALSSEAPRRDWREALCLLALTPMFSILETIAISRALVRVLRQSKPTFTVIRKPA